ncbi:hypothetical protein CEXT_624171 [Caerostris extrusa]|uniref:Uncharacterized protein n=1 Tax=Caerostris extrusa TaxID=172846 RepID=A0AAV4P5V3_CAEEX|nr:hypothetical protein CEXT_624171 [Caerostris extrusa]
MRGTRYIRMPKSLGVDHEDVHDIFVCRKVLALIVRMIMKLNMKHLHAEKLLALIIRMIMRMRKVCRKVLMLIMRMRRTHSYAEKSWRWIRGVWVEKYYKIFVGFVRNCATKMWLNCGLTFFGCHNGP